MTQNSINPHRVTVLTPKRFTSLQKPEPFTSVNVFNLAAFVPLLHSISANILPSKRAGSDAQRNSSFQGKTKKNATPFSSKQILNLHALVHLLISTNWLMKGRGALCKPGAPRMQPINGICELQQASSPEIRSLLPHALGSVQ